MRNPEYRRLAGEKNKLVKQFNFMEQPRKVCPRSQR